MEISENKMIDTVEHREQVIEGILDLIVSEYQYRHDEGILSVLFVENLLEDTKQRLKYTKYRK